MAKDNQGRELDAEGASSKAGPERSQFINDVLKRRKEMNERRPIKKPTGARPAMLALTKYDYKLQPGDTTLSVQPTYSGFTPLRLGVSRLTAERFLVLDVRVNHIGILHAQDVQEEEVSPCFPCDVFAGSEQGLSFFRQMKMRYPDELHVRVRNLDTVGKCFHAVIVGVMEDVAD